ncbi:aldo-keto reductase family 1 member B1-like [Palaemon carinicauda]|uniref:aldo-keto reductase family 1 member B1-like n=1 Tax=Palaemon carinicauda TaxID=392227 RepID=UPI0035B64361
MGEKSVLLSSGHRMPLLGLGCWQSPIEVLKEVIVTALDLGYRHIDTAFQYRNEEGVGEGIQKWLQKTGRSRSEIFVVTKLPMIGMHTGGVEKCLKMSLEKLKLDYVDLYLVHSPVGLKTTDYENVYPVNEKGLPIIDESTDHIAIWKEMEKMADKGLTKSIGISNFNIRQMRKICANARIQPAVNQVEMHAQFQQFQLQEFCKSRNIVLTAYSPFASPGRPASYNAIAKRPVPNLLEDPVVTLIAERHKVTTAQVLLKFFAQENIVVIPKSANPERIKTNGDIWSFTLSQVEMAALKSLDRGEEGRTFAVLPGFEDHPECPW